MRAMAILLALLASTVTLGAAGAWTTLCSPTHASTCVHGGGQGSGEGTCDAPAGYHWQYNGVYAESHDTRLGQTFLGVFQQCWGVASHRSSQSGVFFHQEEAGGAQVTWFERRSTGGDACTVHVSARSHATGSAFEAVDCPPRVMPNLPLLP